MRSSPWFPPPRMDYQRARECPRNRVAKTRPRRTRSTRERPRAGTRPARFAARCPRSRRRAEVIGEPRELALGVNVLAKVAELTREDFDAWDMRRQPVAVGRRDQRVGSAVPE